ncbi:MAG: hypothetical protein ACJ798_06765 [Phenylobacterium sp.]
MLRSTAPLDQMRASFRGTAGMPSYYLTCGEFIADSQSQPNNKGIRMNVQFIDFIPERGAVVALIQAVKCTRGVNLTPQALIVDYPSGGSGVRAEGIWTDEHWAIDAPGEKRFCPGFGMEFPAGANNLWARWEGATGSGAPGGDGRLGVVVQAPNALSFTPAMLSDHPSRAGRAVGTAFHHQFESVALRIANSPGGVTAEVRGVIRWGYKVDETDPGVLTVDAPVVANRPSATWISAATQWNRVKGARGRIPGDAAGWAA